MSANPIDFSLLELKPDHKYILFVDPSSVDIQELSRIDPAPNTEVLIFPVRVPSGMKVQDCIFLKDCGGTAEEFIQKFTGEDKP